MQTDGLDIIGVRLFSEAILIAVHNVHYLKWKRNLMDESSEIEISMVGVFVFDLVLFGTEEKLVSRKPEKVENPHFNTVCLTISESLSVLMTQCHLYQSFVICTRVSLQQEVL